MSEEAKRDEWEGFETIAIAPGRRWFDLIEKVLYENSMPYPIRIRLGHTARKVVHVVIGKATEEDEQKLAVKAMEGEVIE